MPLPPADSAAPSATPRIAGFKGINNRIEPPRLGLDTLLVAGNSLCDNAGVLRRRPGTVVVAGEYVDLHATRGGRLLALDTANQLVEINPSGEATVWHTGITGAPFQWAELGYALFLQSAYGQWAIYPHQAMAWGSLCPAVPADPDAASDPISYPPPLGDRLSTRRGQLVVSAWEADRNRSILYYSRPDYPHEFRLDRDWTMVPGRVTLLINLPQGLLIGTDRALYVDTVDSPLTKLADFGALPGEPAFDGSDSAVFWTQRGLCRALPLALLTDAALTPSLRARASVGLFPWEGSTYAVVHQYGPAQLSPWSVATWPLPVTTEHSLGVTP